MRHTPIYTPQFEELFRDFERAMTAKGYSPKQAKPHFPVHIREFLHFMEERGVVEIVSITTQHIIAYRDYLSARPNARREGGLSDSLINDQMLTIRLFFDHLLDTEVLDATPADLPGFSSGIKNPRQIATVEEMRELYAVCGCKRDRALLSLAYGCGLRRHELVMLNVSDVLLHKGLLLVRDGKGGKSRTIPLSDAVLSDLRGYIVDERHQTDIPKRGKRCPSFLLNKQGHRLSGDKANTRLKELVALTGNEELMAKNLTLHCLRHSIACHLTDRGASIEFVQKFLGHADLNATNIYAVRRKRQTALLKRIG